MQTFEIINPSDTYTIKGEQVVCDVAALLLGNGKYGLEGAKEPNLGLVAFMAPAKQEAKIQEVLGCVLGEWINANGEALADALDSVVIGNRRLFDSMMEHVTDENRAEAAAKWHDENRSSMNDIGTRARAMSESLRAEAGAAQ